MGEDYIFRYLDFDMSYLMVTASPSLYYEVDDATPLTRAERETEILKFMRGKVWDTDILPTPADMTALFGDQPTTPDATTAYNWVYGDGGAIISRFTLPFVTTHFPLMKAPAMFTEYAGLYKRIYDTLGTSQALGLSYLYNMYGLKKCYLQTYYIEQLGTGSFIPNIQV